MFVLQRITKGRIMSAKKEHIPMLNGLRGLAALIVFVSHASIVGFLSKYFGHGFGQVGVMLFFVLSGFLMARLYLHQDFSLSNVIEYARARVGRVVPLYILVIIVSLLITDAIYPEFRYAMSIEKSGELLLALFLVHAPYELWTIPVEAQFYLVFVLFWWLYKQVELPRGIILFFPVLVCLPTIITIFLWREKFSILSTYGFSFFIGVFTFIRHDFLRSYLAKLPNWLGLFFLVFIFLNLPEIRMEYGLVLSKGGYWVSTWLDPFTWLGVYGLFLCCLARLPSLKLLNNKLFKFFGEISYGFYLLHYPILMLVSDFIGVGYMGLLAGFSITVLLSYLSLWFFERPIMKMIRE